MDRLSTEGCTPCGACVCSAVAAYAARIGLTERQRQILLLEVLATERATVALELGISAGTVKFHVRGILVRAGCASVRRLRHEVFAELRRAVIASMRPAAPTRSMPAPRRMAGRRTSGRTTNHLSRKDS